MVHPPVATIVLIGLTAAAWAFLQGLGGQTALLQSLCSFALIPGKLFGSIPADALLPLGDGSAACGAGAGTSAATLVSHMFMHGGWFHLIGNLWFLWVFGDNVEDAMGSGRFVAFYLACGLGAAFAQIGTDPGSAVPMVGASGAIGGVMGAYAFLYPRARVHTLVPLGFYITSVSLPAVFMLGYWFVIQLLGGIPSLGAQGGGVAFWAHIGGFLAGLVLVGPMKSPERLAAHEAQTRRLSARYQFPG